MQRLYSVPVKIAAKVYGKNENWVRAGLIAGWLKIGYATRKGKLITSLDEMDSRKGRINYYISPKKLEEDTGFIWEDRINGQNTKCTFGEQ